MYGEKTYPTSIPKKQVDELNIALRLHNLKYIYSKDDKTKKLIDNIRSSTTIDIHDTYDKIKESFFKYLFSFEKNKLNMFTLEELKTIKNTFKINIDGKYKSDKIDSLYKILKAYN